MESKTRYHCVCTLLLGAVTSLTYYHGPQSRLDLRMQAPASVCPGYKHVEAFSNEDDYYESEEEVSYITLDLGDVEPQLVPSATTYRLIVCSILYLP